MEFKLQLTNRHVTILAQIWGYKNDPKETKEEFVARRVIETLNENIESYEVTQAKLDAANRVQLEQKNQEKVCMCGNVEMPKPVVSDEV